jgi:hypothetical protein
MVDFRPITMVMVNRAEVFRTRNRPQGVQIALDNGWLQLDWPQTVRQRLRTSAVFDGGFSASRVSIVAAPTVAISVPSSSILQELLIISSRVA